LREELSFVERHHTTVQKLGLTAARPGSDGELREGMDTAGSGSFQGGVDTEATAMDTIMARARRVVWQPEDLQRERDQPEPRHRLGNRLANEPARRIRGIPKLSLTVRSTVASVTLVASSLRCRRQAFGQDHHPRADHQKGRRAKGRHPRVGAAGSRVRRAREPPADARHRQHGPALQEGGEEGNRADQHQLAEACAACLALPLG